MSEWFTSDTHFGHKNVIDYCKRPFGSVEEMDAALVRRWNALVHPDDVVWHLGDFAFGPKDNAILTLQQLNGKIRLVRGNHDRSARSMWAMGFAEVVESVVIERSGVNYYLHHQPEPESAWRGSEYQLCGHVHEKWRRRGNMINVGVDQWSYAPVSLEEIREACGLNADDALRIASGDPGDACAFGWE